MFPLVLRVWRWSGMEMEFTTAVNYLPARYAKARSLPPELAEILTSYPTVVCPRRSGSTPLKVLEQKHIYKYAGASRVSESGLVVQDYRRHSESDTGYTKGVSRCSRL